MTQGRPSPTLANGALAFLVGTWRGQGHGEYPTIDAFSYREEVSIGHVPGKPFLRYEQCTSADDTDEPMHTEVGFLRPLPGGTAELVIAQPSGVVETLAGSIDGTSITFHSTGVGCTPSAKMVEATTRSFELRNDTLTIRLEMAAVGRPLTHHLTSVLYRVLG